MFDKTELKIIKSYFIDLKEKQQELMDMNESIENKILLIVQENIIDKCIKNGADE